MQRDPRDRRYRERLAGSTLASLLFHALIAMLLFTVVLNTAEEGASETQLGGSLVTISLRAPVVASRTVPAQRAAVRPRAPHAAPIPKTHLARPARQPLRPTPHELSRFEPTAPPNPTPLPQASAQPNPQPTQAAYAPMPEQQLPAAPTSAPTPSLVAVTVTMAPTSAPSPAPTAKPTAVPRTPAPAPAETAAPRPTTSPAPAPGVASPSPTKGPSVTPARHGVAPSPAPKGARAPGPSRGTGARHRAPSRPVHVLAAPTAPPAPRRRRAPAPDINARLRALLPHNAVHPSEGGFHPHVTLRGTMEPTPPPQVLAITKFIFDELGVGGEAKIKMWVTAVRHVGPLTYCDGWLVRYPHSGQPPFATGTMAHPIAGGITIGTSGPPGGTLPPIVEAHASTLCSQRHLRPFAPPAGSSP